MARPIGRPRHGITIWAPQGRDHRAQEGFEKHVSNLWYCQDPGGAATNAVGPPDSPSSLPSGTQLARRGLEVEVVVVMSTSSSTSSSIGPITGEELTTRSMPEGFVSPTSQCKGRLSPFESESSPRYSVGFETDRNSEGQFTASDIHGIDADIPFTALDDHKVSDDLNEVMNFVTDYEYDSELEVSEIQFETLETGEMCR